MRTQTDYTSFAWETRDAGLASGEPSHRLYKKEEFLREQRSRFDEQSKASLREGAEALGLEIAKKRYATRAALLDAIATARWERLPARYKSNTPEVV